MKVKLINVAEYDIKDGKSTEVPFEAFVNLCGGVGTGEIDNLPKVRLFKTMGEFINLSVEEMQEINQEENIRLLSNGQFLVFLKGNAKNKEKTDTKVTRNATTNTEENKGE